MSGAKSEKYTHWICTRACLSGWCYANPYRSKGKELCDVAVVFGDDLILFSVKEITLLGDGESESKRWLRKAVEESVKQLTGAWKSVVGGGERVPLETLLTNTGEAMVALPKVPVRRVHLVAVAFGAERKLPICSGEQDDGLYVHVFDEAALECVLGELDTVGDLLEYLRAKEESFTSYVVECEQDLLAFYLKEQRKFPRGKDLVLVEPGLWNVVTQRPEYIDRKRKEQRSYWWDRQIEGQFRMLAEDHGQSELRNVYEPALRRMASENRLRRRALTAQIEQLGETGHLGGRRIVDRGRSVGYVLFRGPDDMSRTSLSAHLLVRCMLARKTYDHLRTVIGLGWFASAPKDALVGLSFFECEDWSDERERQLVEGTKLLDLQAGREVHCSVDEYSSSSL